MATKNRKTKNNKKKIVTVNDKMQKGYRYALSAPTGRNFDPEFRPQLTPAEMLRLGVFGGKYMTDCAREFPRNWFARAKLAGKHSDPALNFYGVDASQPLSVWRKRDGSIRTIRAAGFSGTAAITWDAASRMRTRGRSGAGRRSGVTSGRLNETASRVTLRAGHGSARPCCIGPMTVGEFDRARRPVIGPARHFTKYCPRRYRTGA